MTYFLQHTHGNYPVIDYLCPHCDLGGDKPDVDWDALKESPPK